MTTTKKSLGITAIAVFSAFGGILCLIIGTILLSFGATPKGSALILAIGFLVTFLAVFSLASVYGLWSLQEWGRMLTQWIYGISIVLGFGAMFPIFPKQEFSLSNTVLQAIGIGIDVLILYYLSKPHIKVLFK